MQRVAGGLEPAGLGGSQPGLPGSLRWVPVRAQWSTEVIFPGPDATVQARATEEPGPAELPTEPPRSGRHSPHWLPTVLCSEEVIFQAPVSGVGKAGDSSQAEESVDTQTSIKQPRLGTREGLSEQIQLTGPPLRHSGLGVREASVLMEAWSGDGKSIQHAIGPQRHQTTELIVPMLGI